MISVKVLLDIVLMDAIEMPQERSAKDPIYNLQDKPIVYEDELIEKPDGSLV